MEFLSSRTAEAWLGEFWTLLACERRTIVWYFAHSLALPFFEIGMETDLFQFCGHCWVFQICWDIECSTLITSSFRIWNSSAGILSPPLALFVVMLPKAHLTSHSRLSGSRWVTTPQGLPGSLRTCLYSCSVFSCHLFFLYAFMKELTPLYFLLRVLCFQVLHSSLYLIFSCFKKKINVR